METDTQEKLYTKNEVDFAYLIGVLNTAGLDGVQKETERLLAIGKKPHEIIDAIKVINKRT